MINRKPEGLEFRRIYEPDKQKMLQALRLILLSQPKAEETERRDILLKIEV